MLQQASIESALATAKAKLQQGSNANSNSNPFSGSGGMPDLSTSVEIENSQIEGPW